MAWTGMILDYTLSSHDRYRGLRVAVRNGTVFDIFGQFQVPSAFSLVGVSDVRAKDPILKFRVRSTEPPTRSDMDAVEATIDKIEATLREGE